MTPGSRVYILEYAHMSLARELSTREWIVHRVEPTLSPATLAREERVTQYIVVLSDAERSLMVRIRRIYDRYHLSTIGRPRLIDHREESCMEVWIADRLHLSLARSDRGIHPDEEKYILSQDRALIFLLEILGDMHRGSEEYSLYRSWERIESRTIMIVPAIYQHRILLTVRSCLGSEHDIRSTIRYILIGLHARDDTRISSIVSMGETIECMDISRCRGGAHKKKMDRLKIVQ